MQQQDLVLIESDALDVVRFTEHVTDPAAGAISTFIGTTRNNFAGKDVLHLEYEAYEPMALKVMQVCCDHTPLAACVQHDRG